MEQIFEVIVNQSLRLKDGSLAEKGQKLLSSDFGGELIRLITTEAVTIGEEVEAPEPKVVGESGPELFVPKQEEEEAAEPSIIRPGMKLITSVDLSDSLVRGEEPKEGEDVLPAGTIGTVEEFTCLSQPEEFEQLSELLRSYRLRIGFMRTEGDKVHSTEIVMEATLETILGRFAAAPEEDAALRVEAPQTGAETPKEEAAPKVPRGKGGAK